MAIPEELWREIDATREQWSQTHRPTVPAMEELLYLPFAILDHGFVRVIDYQGDDAAIVQAARVSYGKGTKSVRDDRALIRYLLRKKHTTPFEMCELKLHVKLPIFVARQWIRTRTASVNEYSARFSVLEDDFYVPEIAQICAQSTENRQGRGEQLADAVVVQESIRSLSKLAYATYTSLLERGVARELARIIVPPNVYSMWYWKIDLHNLLRFQLLRLDERAQWEIRQYAEVIDMLLRKWVPVTHQAFMDYQRYAVSLSAMARGVIKRLLKGEQVQRDYDLMSKREWDELIGEFELEDVIA